MEEITRAELIYPHKEVESAKAWKEMIHRYFASTLGLLIVIMAVIAWKNRREAKQQFYLPLFLVALVIFQGMLGMWTVTLLLKPAVVTMHLLMGMTTLALLLWMYLNHAQVFQQTGTSVSNMLRKASLLALVVLVVQIFLGGWTSTNYVALYCPDFPTCQGQWWPEMSFAEGFRFIGEIGINYEGGLLSNNAGVAVHVMHRMGAVITLVVLSALALLLLVKSQSSILRGMASIILVLLFTQFSLGVANVLLYLPTALAVAHNAVAALLLLSVIVLNYLVWVAHKKG
jgi:cytochrome c oxidase assembly protein subunit 15